MSRSLPIHVGPDADEAAADAARLIAASLRVLIGVIDARHNATGNWTVSICLDRFIAMNFADSSGFEFP